MQTIDIASKIEHKRGHYLIDGNNEQELCTHSGIESHTHNGDKIENCKNGFRQEDLFKIDFKKLFIGCHSRIVEALNTDIQNDIKNNSQVKDDIVFGVAATQ